MNAPSNPATLVTAGWTKEPDGRWRCPVTHHVHPEKTAMLLASLPTFSATRDRRRRRIRNNTRR